MESFNFLLFVKDFGGLAIAAILIFFAGRILPRRARWFFWTAGFAIIVYEVYLRFNNRKILEKLDQQWQSLQVKKDALKKNNEVLRKETEALSRQLLSLEKRAAESFQELETLRLKFGDQREENQARLKELEEGLEDIQRRRTALANLEEKFNLTSTLIREIDEGAKAIKP